MEFSQSNRTSNLPGPLRPAPDMKAAWRDVDLDFDTAANQLVADHSRDGAVRDLPVTDLRMYAVGGQEGRFALVPLAKHRVPIALRSGALSTLCTKLGAPTEFIRDRLPAPLQLATLNVLLAEEERAMGATLRLRGSEVSAIVSGRYAPLDAPELMETLREVFVEQGILRDVRVKSLVSGMTDALRIILPSTEVALKEGDVSAVGLDVSSSSFGRSAVHVRAITWRVVCTNGLRAEESSGRASFRHIGDPARLKNGLREAVPNVIAQASGLMDQWRLATRAYVEDLASTIDELREFTMAEREVLEAAVLQEAETERLPKRLDAYRFVNGMTKAAHHAEPARRLELEAMAGAFLARSVR